MGHRIGGLLLVMLAAVGCDRGEDVGTAPPTPSATPPVRPVLFQFERFTAAPRLDGGEIRLASLRGNVVLLDLFSTWCPPCRRSAPILVSLYERFHAQGLEIVGLAYEQDGESAKARAAVAAFAEEFRIPYVLALGPQVVWEELRRKASVEEIVPTLVLMDRQGMVRSIFADLPPGHEAILADQIERLLAEPTMPSPKPEKG